MEENRKLVTVVFGAFSALGIVTAVIAAAAATQAGDDVRSVFRAVAVIAVALTVLTGYVAMAARRKWWPLRDSPTASTGEFDSER
jgi:uncharacterized membrane protein